MRRRRRRAGPPSFPRQLLGILLVLVIAYAVIVGVGRLAGGERGARYLVVAAIGLGLAWAVYSVDRTGRQLPRSGRDPSDVGPLSGIDPPNHP